MGKRKTKQKSNWQRTKAKGRCPVMLQFTAFDHAIIKKAAEKSNLTIAGYCQLQARLQAYIDTGECPADRSYQPCPKTISPLTRVPTTGTSSEKDG